jgi:hypothetical protein
MTALPNPFDFASALVPAMAAEPVVSLEPIPSLSGRPEFSELAGAEMERAVPIRPLGVRVQEQDPALISEPALSSAPPLSGAETWAGVALTGTPAVFSEHNTNTPREIPIDFDALYRAITNEHPRDLDLDPPPLFLRKPRPAFLRALYHLAGAQS